MTKSNLISASILALSIAVPAQTVFAQSLDEIIVTSQKREQGLQEVPISISAVSGATIENRSIDSMMDLSASVPNFNIQENQIDSTLMIRGVTTGNNKGFEQSCWSVFRRHLLWS